MKRSSFHLQRLLAGFAFLMLFSCQKKVLEDKSASSPAAGHNSTLTAPDIYIAGSINRTQAVYWKNGVQVDLPGGQSANGIAVSGTDVYVCGSSLNASGVYVAQYWKNGVLTNLGNGIEETTTTGIAVHGTDVYISGYSGRYVQNAIIWKNGVPTSLGSGNTSPVFVSTNGDVYTADRNSLSYWKNGTKYTLPAPPSPNAPNVKTIKEVGGVVYAVGVNGPASSTKPIYWVNGVVQPLMIGYTWNEARDIAVDGGQAYIAGIATNNFNSYQIGYWEAASQDFTKWGTQTTIGYPRIAVDNGDIYICGMESNYPVYGVRAMYWLNSNPTYLTDGSVDSYASDIVLVH